MEAHYYQVTTPSDTIDGHTTLGKTEHTFYIPGKGLIVCDSLEPNSQWLDFRFIDYPEAIEQAEERISRYGIHTEGCIKPVTVRNVGKRDLSDDLVANVISLHTIIIAQRFEENAKSLATILQS